MSVYRGKKLNAQVLMICDSAEARLLIARLDASPSLVLARRPNMEELAPMELVVDLKHLTV